MRHHECRVFLFPGVQPVGLKTVNIYCWWISLKDCRSNADGFTECLPVLENWC